MKKNLTTIAIVLLFSIGLFSCSKTETSTVVTVAPMPVTATVKDLMADTVLGLDPKSGMPYSAGKFTFYSIEKNTIISNADSATNKWDLAFASTKILTNGGTSGTALGGAFIYKGLFDDLKTIPVDSNFNVDNYNRIIGFIGYEKNNAYMVFKTKDMTSKRDRGARCDEAGKDKTISTINAILGQTRYTNENTRLKKDTNGNLIHEAISHDELCVTQELILRYYDKIRNGDKQWFISPYMALYYKLYTIIVK